MHNIKLITYVFFTLCTTTILSQHTHNEDDDHFDIHTTDDHDHDHDDHSKDIWRAVGITVFAGCASFLGAFAIFCIKKEYIGIMPCALAFSAGVTIHLTFISLIPESVEQFNHAAHDDSEALSEFYTLLCVIGGLIIVIGMESLFHRMGVTHTGHSHDTSSHGTTATHTESAQLSSQAPAQVGRVDTGPLSIDEHKTPAALYGTMSVETHQIEKSNTKNYSQVSYSVAFALILHHFPEGIATFVSLYYDFEFGILVALALALHDIPSGICIGVPIYLSSGSIKKPFILCLFAGIVYPIGAFIGWVIIETTTEEVLDIFIAILFGITAGIMLYISFVELLPTAIIAANTYSLTKNKNQGKKSYNVATMSISWLFLGFLVMAISNILLNAVGGHDH